MRRLSIIGFLCMSVWLAGCYRIRYRVENVQGQTYSTRYWNHYFFWGMVPEHERYSVEDFCRSERLIAVESSVGPANVIAWIFSVGLSSGTTLRGECLKKSGIGAAPTAASGSRPAGAGK